MNDDYICSTCEVPTSQINGWWQCDKCQDLIDKIRHCWCPCGCNGEEDEYCTLKENGLCQSCDENISHDVIRCGIKNPTAEEYRTQVEKLADFFRAKSGRDTNSQLINTITHLQDQLARRGKS